MSEKETREGKDIYKRLVVQIARDVECGNVESKIYKRGRIYTIELRKGEYGIAYDEKDEDFFADVRGNCIIDRDGKISIRADSQKMNAHRHWIGLCLKRLKDFN